MTFLALLLATGCGGGQHETQTPAAENQAQPLPLEPIAEEMTGVLDRQDMLAVLGVSVGDFLRRVQVEVETNDGGYVGWRITHLPETIASWLDIRTGDVVTSVNGLPIEQPNEAQQVFEILQVASEVRIELIRDGERRALRIPIEDEPPPDAGQTAPDELRGPEQKSSEKSTQIPF